MSIKSGSLAGKRTLRGRRLVDAALREIGDLGSWSRGEKLTWGNLAKRLGVSRQALQSRPKEEGDELKAAFWKQKEVLRETEDGLNPDKVIRRTLNERIEASKAEIVRLQRQLDGWIEKWATVEYNCRRMGVDADEILTPLAKPARQIPR